jgi:hypothetical protein
LGNLTADQAAATKANQGALTAGANNAQLALQALSGMGSLGGNVQEQENQMAQAKAQAAQQAAEYNSQLMSAANQYNTEQQNQAQQMNLANAQDISNTNTGLNNQRTMYNAQLPNTIFNEQMQKAGGVANQYGNQANLAQKQAEQQNAFTGNLIGAGATIGGDYLMGNALKSASATGQNPNQPNTDQYYQAAHGGEVPCYAEGGEVHDHEICMKMGGAVPGQANVPGDSTQNDTIPAKLSPHEIVLPRTVAQAPNAPQEAANFVSQIKGQPTAQSAQQLNFADIIRKLEENGLELRLGVK